MSKSPDEKTVFSQGSLFDSDFSQSHTSHSTPLLFVVLDCLYYNAGEKVNGEILVNLPHDYPASTLNLTSRGFEQIKILDQQKTHINPIYDLETVVHSWTDITPQGQYVFPFTFKLPLFSPATFSFIGSDSKNTLILAEIVYEVMVFLEIPSNENQNLSHIRHINIRSRNSRNSPSPAWQSLEPVVGMCCSNKGTSFFKVSINREEHPLTDGILRYKLEVDNSNCIAKILNIQGQVKMELEVTIANQTFVIFKSFSKSSKETWISSHSSLVNEKEFEYECEIMFDDGVNPSSNHTNFIKCYYFVEFAVEYDMKLKTPVMLKMPFHVNPKHNFARENPKVPENWSPRESPIFSAFIDESLSNAMSGEVINLFID